MKRLLRPSHEKTNAVSHDRQEETPEAKARWFSSLRMEGRMQMLCDFTDLALSANPSLLDKKHAKSTPGRIQVISKNDFVSSKRAAGRPVDLEDVRMLELPGIDDAESEGAGDA